MKPSPRPLTSRDRDVARAYAARNPSDPFAYARALSRLANGLCNESDFAPGGAI